MTTVELFKDIGLTKSMKKTMEFATKEAQTTWFSSKVAKTVTNVAFNKLQNKLKLPMDYGEALAYTYVRFKNLDKSGRIYYYFIDSVALVDDSTVSFQLAIDPIQTFMTEWSLDTCMVNRKHCDRWGFSDYPLRENSNIEGIQATYVVTKKQKLSESYQVGAASPYRVGAVLFTFKKEYTFFTCLSPIVFTSVEGQSSTLYFEKESTYYRLPWLEECYDNVVFTHMGIDPESVTSMCFLPFMPAEYSITFKDSKYVVSVTNASKLINNTYGIFTVEEYSFIDRINTLKISRPTKPTDGTFYAVSHEPAMFKEPYMIRSIQSADGLFNQDIPDIVINQPESKLYVRPAISPSQQVVYCSINESLDDSAAVAGSKSAGLVTSMMPPTFDVVNNAWLTYSLTQRDSDRNIINNNNMQNAISNLLFMGYGGALVGSRGGGLIKKDIPIRDNIAGVPSSQQPILGYRAGLNPALGGAVGLAAGASIVTSLIDSHFAWENQKQQERKIQNKAQQITISGNSAYNNALTEYSTPVYVELTCDQVNFDKAAANFWYYGYEINEWQLPDIKSRKYFDYIMTNGAVIKGSIPQDMKEQIAAIFDNGVTLFHSDYCTDLEYPAYENIERGLL